MPYCRFATSLYVRWSCLLVIDLETSLERRLSECQSDKMRWRKGEARGPVGAVARMQSRDKHKPG